MDLNSLTALELHFADHFDSGLFPVLAHHYFEKGDFSRSKKVCEIGLEYHPGHVDGLYILGKTQLALGEITQAEKSLKSALKNGSVHLKAALTLTDVQRELNRSDSTIMKTWELIQQWDPGNQEARENLSKKTIPEVKPEKLQKEEKKSTPQSHKGSDSIDISPRLATFTMVAVLRNQGLHFQALQVLDLLEEKGEDVQRITEERKRIQEALDE